MVVIVMNRSVWISGFLVFFFRVWETSYLLYFYSYALPVYMQLQFRCYELLDVFNQIPNSS